MSTNPLNDISKVYLERIVETSHLETDMKKRAEDNEKARKEMMKTKAHKDMAAAARKKMEEGLDPVGQEDADIDNDGDTDKSDKYLHNRRKSIGKAITKKKSVKEGYSNWRQDLAEVVDGVIGDQEIKEKKIKNKIKTSAAGGGIQMGEAVENLGGTLLEMVEIDEFDYILESAYDELLEEGYDDDAVEEALEFALTEAKVTFGHDTPTAQKKKEGLLSAARKRLAGAKAAAKQAVATGARKVAKGALGVARKMEAGDKKPAATAARKPSTYRGAGAGTKERVSSGSYTPPAKKKAEKPADPWEGSATTPTKPKAKKAAAPKAKAPAKKKKTSKLDALLADVRSESVIGDRARSAVTDDRLSSEQEKTSASMDKLRAQTKRHEKSTALARTQARIAAKKSENTARAMHPKPGVSGYRIEQTQIDEKTLTTAETKKKEELVKSLKKRAGDFEKRYPGRGKEVMYATATKMAKKMAEDIAIGGPSLTPTPTSVKQKPQNASAINQVLVAKQKVDRAQADLAAKQKMASGKGVNLSSLSA